jgi:DNA-binding MarR family transcriptional regulator
MLVLAPTALAPQSTSCGAPLLFRIPAAFANQPRIAAQWFARNRFARSFYTRCTMTQRPALPFTLDEQLCFALYSTSLAMTKAYKPLLDKLGLTYPQYLAMLVLWEADDVTVKDLAARLNLDSATVTPLLKRLEAQGYLERVRGVEDERLVYIRLTKAGTALKRQAREVPAEIFCATQQTPEFLLRLRDDLTRLRSTLNDYMDH